MVGHPKFNYGDKVEFTIGNETIKGEIYIIDKYGVFEDNTDVHYDIMSNEKNCLYKHIKETLVKAI